MRATEPKKSRVAAGQTQSEAAHTLGVAFRTWQNWEGGQNIMPDYALRLYRHLVGLERIPFKGAA